MALGLVSASLLLAAVVRRPALAAYIFLGAMPLLAGLGRGSGVPLLRPYEVLLFGLLVGVGARWLVDLARGRWLAVPCSRIDVATVLLATTMSILPLLWLYGRGGTPTTEDLQYSVLLWKYYAVFLLVRMTVRTVEQVRVCLIVSLVSAAVVAALAILQSLQVLGVAGLLAEHYAEGRASSAQNQRGLSTLASSIAVGDVMNAHLAIAMALQSGPARRSLLLRAAAALYAAGALASGQFSSAIGLLVTLAVLSYVSKDTRRTTASLLPLLPFAVLGTWSVIQKRLRGFQSDSGLPMSWNGRVDNLRTYFLPPLRSDGNVVFGVQPAGRLRAHETWRDFIYPESGYVYLLWVGGIPCLLAFCYFAAECWRTTLRTARERTDAVGVAATGALAATSVLVVLMTLDAHLVLRGAADTLFILLALALVAPQSQDAIDATTADTSHPDHRGELLSPT